MLPRRRCSGPPEGQLSFDDAAADVEPLHGLERLGDSVAFRAHHGALLKKMLELQGWDVEETRAFAGDVDGAGGVLVIASKGRRSRGFYDGYEAMARGASFAEVIVDVFEQATVLERRLPPDLKAYVE